MRAYLSRNTIEIGVIVSKPLNASPMFLFSSPLCVHTCIKNLHTHSLFRLPSHPHTHTHTHSGTPTGVAGVGLSVFNHTYSCLSWCSLSPAKGRLVCLSLSSGNFERGARGRLVCLSLSSGNFERGARGRLVCPQSHMHKHTGGVQKAGLN